MTRTTQYAWQLHISREGVVRERDNTGTGPQGEPLGYVEKSETGRTWTARDHERSVLGIERTRRDAAQHVLDAARARWHSAYRQLMNEATLR